jgi:DNA-binding MarR family transcriptional regulator
MDSYTALLVHHLSRAHHQMQSLLEKEIAKESDGGGLQPAMRPIFCALSRQSGLTVSDLAGQLRLAKSSVTGALRRMEAAGLVEQRLDGQDGRRRRSWLTERGKAMISVCERIDATIQKQLKSHLSPEESAELVRLLIKLTESAGGPEAE